MGNLFWANPVDVYITKGSGSGSGSRGLSEVYTPSVTYHGFRYVVVSFR
jgi:hypothetical protein